METAETDGNVRLVVTVFAMDGSLLLVAVTVKETVLPAGGNAVPLGRK
jgi:hypothetical protein